MNKAFFVLLLLSCTSPAIGKMWDTSNPHRFAGDVIQLALPLAGAGMAYAHDDLDGAKQLGKTVLATAVLTEGTKHAFNHTELGTRPNGGGKSFPSGHASNACAGATFIGQRYGWELGAPAMAAAGYVAWTRVDANAHHVRDVVAGCALGVATGLILTSPKPEDGMAVTPWYENKSLGITISSVW